MIKSDVRKYGYPECMLALDAMQKERDRQAYGNDMWLMYDAAVNTVKARVAELKGAHITWVA